MNNKGFSLIELLSAMVIIAIIGGIAVLAYNSFVSKSRTQVYETYEDTIHAELAYYLSFHTDKLPTNGSTKTYLFSDFSIEEFKNPDDPTDTCPNSKIDVKRQDLNGVISLTYKVYLICNNYNSSGTNYREYDN